MCSTLLKNTSAKRLLNKKLKKNGIGETEELLVAQYKEALGKIL